MKQFNSLLFSIINDIYIENIEIGIHPHADNYLLIGKSKILFDAYKTLLYLMALLKSHFNFELFKMITVAMILNIHVSLQCT